MCKITRLPKLQVIDDRLRIASGVSRQRDVTHNVSNTNAQRVTARSSPAATERGALDTPESSEGFEGRATLVSSGR